MKTHCRNGHEYTEANTYWPPNGGNYQCRQCSRDRGRKWVQSNRDRNRDALYRWKYGLTLEEYDAMSAAQGGVCALCAQPDPRGRLVVDHCHETGRVRGLLCTGCNSSLGKLGDTPEKIVAVLAYLVGMDVNDFVLARGSDALRQLLGVEVTASS